MSSVAENKGPPPNRVKQTGEKMNQQDEKVAAPVSEDVAKPVEENQESEKTSRMVPLEALEAERRKRQDAEANSRYKDELLKKVAEEKKPPEPEDMEELVNKGDLMQFHEKLTKQEMAALKREIAEETFKDTQPEAIKLINAHLEKILEKKPWLVDSINSAPNRYARAYEIVNDYMPQVAEKKTQATEAKKMVENAQKPGSPIGVGKSQQLSGVDYMKSIAGKKEFREYRNQLLGR